MAKVKNLRTREEFEGPLFKTQHFDGTYQLACCGFHLQFDNEEKENMIENLNFMEKVNKEWKDRGNTVGDSSNPDSDYMKFLNEAFNGTS